MPNTEKITNRTVESGWTPEWDWSVGNQYGPRKTLVRRDEAINKHEFKTFKIEPMSSTLGAEVFDIDLKQPLSATIKAEINSALALFTEFPQASLVMGDEILISFQPESGSELTFNGHSVFKTPNKQFYNYILNTWLGKFSPNRIFREKISGIQRPEAELVDISAVLVDEQRIKAVGKWFLSVEEKNIAKLKQKKLKTRIIFFMNWSYSFF